MMRFLVNGNEVSVSDTDEVGSGGEARVFRHDDKALKIFHRPEDALRQEDEDEREERLRRKARKIRDFPKGTPEQVVSPEGAVRRPDGTFAGYVMPLVEGKDLRLLSSKTWREKYRVGNEDVTRVFFDLFGLLGVLHEDHGVVCGDINDTNILFDKRYGPVFIDADSFQFGGYPCTVAHQRYMDPRLYGEVLADGPVFDSGSDVYSASVLLFESYLYVHPYGGTHGEHNTLLRRAEAGHSVFRDDVNYPPNAMDWRVLCDGLITWFKSVFEEGRRDAMPLPLLANAWKTCSACGVEHQRRACPLCATTETVIPETKSISDSLELVEVASPEGPIVHGDGKSFVHWEGGTYFREDGSVVLDGDLSPDYRFRTQGRSTWMGKGGKAVKINGGEVVDTIACDTFGGIPVFDTADRGVCFLNEGWLFNSDGTRIGKVVRNRSFLWVGSHAGIGFSSVGQSTRWFAFDPRRQGMSQVDLPDVRGKLLEARAVFHGKSSLVSVVSEDNGKRWGFIAVLGGSEILGLKEGLVSQCRFLGETSSIAVRGGSGLVLTEDGLLTVKPDFAGSLREAKNFEDAPALVSPGCRIFPGDSSGAIVVTGADRVCELRHTGGEP